MQALLEMSVLSKILNPKAKIANVALAILYIAVLSCLFVGAILWQFSLEK